MSVSGQDGFRVNPRSTQEIREVTHSLRDALRINTPKFPLSQVIELALPTVVEDFVCDVREDFEMKRLYGTNIEAMTTPDKWLIELMASTYDNLCKEQGRARFTVAHELGHLFLHQKESPQFARASSSLIQAYENSEWQANTFAAELLMPLHIACNCTSAEEISEVFAVSKEAAAFRWELIKKEISKKKSPERQLWAFQEKRKRN